ncbi:MAG: hypothetical protein SV775_20035, partial [Thermodesulfobacteriota bacterium]|nr:hypothetical protein [Thermodesulfobacteriota bacterium]
NPSYCLDQWMRCVKPSGRCFIEWSIFHGESCTGEADCFGASLEEYRAIIEKKYLIETVMGIRFSMMKQLLKHGLTHGISGVLSIKRTQRSILVIKHKEHLAKTNA